MKATHILVVQAGWVFVGSMPKVPTKDDPTGGSEIVTLEDSACVRQWGTTRGLGEIAIGGPTSETILDPCGRVQVPRNSVLFWIPVDQKKWV